MSFKELIKKHFNTQNQLAIILNVSRSTVNKWCLGKSKPTLEHLVKLSNLLNVDLNELFYCFYEPIQKQLINQTKEQQNE